MNTNRRHGENPELDDPQARFIRVLDPERVVPIFIIGF